MKDNLKFILITIGIILIFFAMGREIFETKAKLKKSQEQVAQDAREKAWLQDELKATKGELVRADRDLRTANSKLAFVNRKMLGVRDSNHILVNEKHGLEHKIALLEEEKRTIEARLSSLSELKKAIRQVKVEMRRDKIRQQEELDKWETAMGNQGFFTKNGKENYKPKVNVEVRPASVSLNKK
jgi:predicted  nucleic acid-binding Zn-ribbon protein